MKQSKLIHLFWAIPLLITIAMSYLYFTQQTALVDMGSNSATPDGSDFLDGEIEFSFTETGQIYGADDIVCVNLNGYTYFKFSPCSAGCEDIGACIDRAPEGCYGFNYHIDSDGCARYDFKDDFGNKCFDCGGWSSNPTSCKTYRQGKCNELFADFKQDYKDQYEACWFYMGNSLKEWLIWADSTASDTGEFEIPYMNENLLCAKSITASGSSISFNIHASVGEPCGGVICSAGETCQEGVCVPSISCNTAEDCEGNTHIECEGYWSCESNQCVWNCGKKEVPIYYIIIPAVATIIGLLIVFLKKRR